MKKLLVGLLSLVSTYSAFAAQTKVPCAGYLSAILNTMQDFQIFASTEGQKIDFVSEVTDAATKTVTYTIQARATEGDIAGKSTALKITNKHHGLGFVQNTYTATLSPGSPTYQKISAEMGVVFQALLDNAPAIENLSKQSSVVTGVTYETVSADKIRIEISTVQLTEGDIATKAPTLVIDIVQHHSTETSWNTYEVTTK